MIPPAITVDLRRSAEICEKYHQRFIEQTALLQIRQERGDGTIEYRQQPLLHLRKMALVGIPIVPASTGEIAGRAQRLDHRHAGLYKAPGQQQGLAADMIAVHRADPRILTLEIVGVPHGRLQQHIGRHLAKMLELIVLGLHRGRVGLILLQLLQQGAPLNHTGFLHIQLQVQLSIGVPRDTPEGFSRRSSNQYGVVVETEPAAIFAGHQGAIVIHRIGHSHGIGRPGPHPLETSDHRRERGPVGSLAGLDSALRLVAGQAGVHSLLVPALVVIKRPDDSQLV